MMDTDSWIEPIDVLPAIIRHYFPVCEVDGSTTPRIVAHLNGSFLVPLKCMTCKFSHEGSCLRASGREPLPKTFKEHIRFFRELALDFGPCGVPDIDEIAACRGKDGQAIWVPAKCSTCRFFGQGFSCDRFWDEYELPCSLDFGRMTEDRARSLLQEHAD